MKTEVNEYNQQASEFLKATKTKFSFNYLGLEINNMWGDKFQRPKYSVTLSRKNKSYTFDFWSSIKDANEGKETIKPYDVLACLSVSYADSFEDFCSEFGYDTDSRKAYSIYEAVTEQTEELKELFSEEEIEMLHEIV